MSAKLKGWLINIRQRTCFPGTFWGAFLLMLQEWLMMSPEKKGRTSACQAYWFTHE